MITEEMDLEIRHASKLLFTTKVIRTDVVVVSTLLKLLQFLNKIPLSVYP